jgi:hypothetical protein
MIAQLVKQTAQPAPQHRRTIFGLVPVLMAFALITAACGGGSEESQTAADRTEAGSDDLPFSDEGSVLTTTSTVPDVGDSGDESDTSGVATGADDQDDSTPPTTAGSGLSPINTVAVGSGGDPDGIYIGKLGTLDPDAPQVPGVVVPPDLSPNMLPLTGEIATVPDRPAAVVKIDNGSAATPHQGLNAADIVIEEEVEGGVTRFAAIFHSTPSIVGPVRSGRTTDLALISSLGSPLLMYSGANQITEGILRSNTNIQNRSHDSSPGGYWRDGARNAPSNLFSDTAPHWASATGGPPPAQFHYRTFVEAAAGVSDDELTVSYPASIAKWTWDGERWLRWQRGEEHLLVSGEQVDAANVVVIEAERIATGMVDSSGGAVPEFYYVGSGRATVFTDGNRIEGTWTRPTLNSVATLTDSDGTPIELTPGRTWIQLVESGAGQLK